VWRGVSFEGTQYLEGSKDSSNEQQVVKLVVNLQNGVRGVASHEGTHSVVNLVAVGAGRRASLGVRDAVLQIRLHRLDYID
jgi:hypothetical protein